MTARVTDILSEHARTRPEQLAVADGALALSWSGLAAAVAGMAQRLGAQGLARGERVAVSASDGASALIAALAVLQAGGVHAPVDHTLAAAEIAQLITALRTPWRLTIPPRAIPDDLAGVALEATGQRPEADPLGGSGSAFLRLSSGTTGAAKGVLLSHATIIARITAANRGLQLEAGDRVLWLLPMAYHFAVSILLYLRVGAAVVFGNALRASATAAIARERQVTAIYASPYHIRRLAELPPGQDLPASVRLAVSTTTALDAGAGAAFHARHGVAVRQGLGIIEVGLPFLSPGSPGERPGELGAPLPDYGVAILDDAGEVLPDGQAGELAISGPGLLDAYLEPWRRREDILWRGSFRTGDRACRASDGSVRLLGRIKDVINVGGVKVFPLEVESVLDAHPLVAASRVIAAPDPRLGEQVHAEVQLKPGSSAAQALAALHHWCAERLAPLKRPAQFTIVDHLALTASGKIRRHSGGLGQADPAAGGPRAGG
jgi:acyl-coenzyme A synthetase/AMP-(fatty) acid ligase